MKNEMCNGLTYDREELTRGIIELLNKLDIERLRMLYLTALTWSIGLK